MGFNSAFKGLIKTLLHPSSLFLRQLMLSLLGPDTPNK